MRVPLPGVRACVRACVRVCVCVECVCVSVCVCVCVRDVIYIHSDTVLQLQLNNVIYLGHGLCLWLRNHSWQKPPDERATLLRHPRRRAREIYANSAQLRVFRELIIDPRRFHVGVAHGVGGRGGRS